MRQSIHSSSKLRCAAGRSAASLVLAAAGSVGAVALTAGQADAAPSTPPPIDAETYTPTAQSGTACNTGFLFSGPQTFTVAGTTAGPYPGVFTESGVVNYTLGFVTSVFAAIHIISPVGTVDIAVNSPVAVAYCPVVSATLLSMATVTITTPDGSQYSDNGTVILSIGVGSPPAVTIAITSTGPVTPLGGPPPALPETPLAIGLPVAGAALLGGAALFAGPMGRRRRRNAS